LLSNLRFLGKFPNSFLEAIDDEKGINLVTQYLDAS